VEVDWLVFITGERIMLLNASSVYDMDELSGSASTTCVARVDG